MTGWPSCCWPRGRMNTRWLPNMATGFIVSGRGDLDVIFKARASAAGADVGYKSNGGVDLAQRFEPRGSTTAVANTNFKNASAVDLAQIFMDINAVVSPAVLTMVAGESENTDLGYADGHVNPVCEGSSMTPKMVGVNELCELVTGTTAMRAISFTHPTVAPANTNATWNTCSITGDFQGPSGVVTRVLTRSAGTYSTGTVGGRQYAYWTFGSSDYLFRYGDVYTVSVTFG
jgi:hypothetical protein